MGRAITMARGVPTGDGRGGLFRRLRRVVVIAAAIGLGAVAAGAAMVASISIMTVRTIDAFRNADPAMVQAMAWTSPGRLVLASQASPRADAPTATANVTGAIPPVHHTAGLNARAPVSNRLAKADRLPWPPQPIALPPLSPPQTVAAVRREVTADAAAARAPAVAAEGPAITGSIAATPTVVTTKRYMLASYAPVEPSPVAPFVSAAPLPPRRPADAPRGSENDAPDAASRTAVYDIAGRTVHMPNGVKLAAHSGLGKYFDNPRYIKVKNQGPTPPNVYRLTMREKLFHGVRAIRLTPVFEDKMHGRDGMLAHTYLLGPRGESNGCVSFENYPKFLQAFLRGDIDRMVVVPDLKSETLRMARARGREADRLALND